MASNLRPINESNDLQQSLKNWKQTKCPTDSPAKSLDGRTCPVILHFERKFNFEKH